MGKIWWAALLGGGLAAGGNLLVFAIANVLGANLQVPSAPGSTTLVPLTAGQVIWASLIPALFAGGLLAILGRFARNPWPVFLGISGVFLLLSFGGPLNIPADTTTKLVLNLMHVVAAVAIVGALWRFTRVP
ncbi:DUF6069 family protein [Meiothermus taiwanensis]|nr:DUF6069 family protein [Meiothermus taiwanensis]KZK16571.1 hypothetical protein A3962_05665 [Meiothermus taiwanensis]